MSRKLYLETFGCQMNVLDSELVLGQLRARATSRSRTATTPTSSSTTPAPSASTPSRRCGRGSASCATARRPSPALVIGVIGCMAERDGDEHLRAVPARRHALRPGRARQAAGAGPQRGRDRGERQRCSARGSRRERQVALMGANVRRSSTLAAAEDNLELLDLSRSISPSDDVAQAYVRITRGCNKFCTYCVVPYTRGPEVHRPPQNIIDEVRRLADAGAKEVTLLGQTINHYHYTHGDGRETTLRRAALPDPRGRARPAAAAVRHQLPARLHRRGPAGHARLRADLPLPARPRPARHRPRAEADEPRLHRPAVPRLHRPRPRATCPTSRIASDFIVGFPTETEEEFEQTVELVRDCRFKNSFIFKYSPAPRHGRDRPVRRRRARGREAPPEQRAARRAAGGQRREQPRRWSARRSRCWSKARASW